MGTDIHGVVQQRFPDEPWETVSQIIRERNYALFSALAGVRCLNGDLAPVQESRGLPADFACVPGDPEWHKWYEGSDEHGSWMGDHSHGWATPDEIEAWPHWDAVGPYGGTWHSDVGDGFWAWLKYVRARWGDGEIRIVFGFDS